MFSSLRRLQKRKVSLITMVQSAAVNHASYTRICSRRHARIIRTNPLPPMFAHRVEILRSTTRTPWWKVYRTIDLLFWQPRRREESGTRYSIIAIYSRSVKKGRDKTLVPHTSLSINWRSLETCILTITSVVMNKFKNIVKCFLKFFAASKLVLFLSYTRDIRFIINLVCIKRRA